MRAKNRPDITLLAQLRTEKRTASIKYNLACRDFVVELLGDELKAAMFIGKIVILYHNECRIIPYERVIESAEEEHIGAIVQFLRQDELDFPISRHTKNLKYLFDPKSGDGK